tara:strand:+ start:105 stop:275 length:171 start_codon:yes stop_codon:yes gene_type:complete
MTLEKFETELEEFIKSKLPEGAYSIVHPDHDHEMGIWVINVDGAEFSDHPQTDDTI